jgi:hypothetical protein
LWETLEDVFPVYLFKFSELSEDFLSPEVLHQFVHFLWGKVELAVGIADRGWW